MSLPAHDLNYTLGRHPAPMARPPAKPSGMSVSTAVCCTILGISVLRRASFCSSCTISCLELSFAAFETMHSNSCSTCVHKLSVCLHHIAVVIIRIWLLQ
ncbi:TPA: hypothetical protein ACH3X3_011060 [Trebouxia sp. C0006]